MSPRRHDLPPGFPVDPDDAFDPPDPPPADRRVVIGRIVKVHGLKGDLKVIPETWRPERFSELDGLWCEGPDGRLHWLTVKRLRAEPGALYVRFNEAATRDFAEPLVGGTLIIDEADRAELPEGGDEDLYYIDDLEGCTVVDDQHGELGTLTRVMDLPANDVWQVDGPFGEILIPAIRQVVDEVDVASKRIRVTLPEGLLPDDQAERRDPERATGHRPSSRDRHRRR